jgi:hypothetical protein
MTLPLPKNELLRLAKLCGMLGSAHDGERAAAALKADQLVRAHGLTWGQLLVPTQRQLISPSAAPAGSIAQKLALCRQHLSSLTEWERGFVLSLHQFRRLSEKQLRVLNRIAEEISEGRRAA